MFLTSIYATDLLNKHLAENSIEGKAVYIDNYCNQQVAQFELWEDETFITYYYIYIDATDRDEDYKTSKPKMKFTTELRDIPYANNIPEPLKERYRVEREENNIGNCSKI